MLRETKNLAGRFQSLRRKHMKLEAEIEQEAAREALRQQLFTERLTSFGQGYLQELESDALIVER